MRYCPYGPFELTRSDDNFLFLEDRERAVFWSEVEDEVPGLADACGCYVFALQSGRAAVPWYVGKAERQTFRQECLTDDKVHKFNSVLASRRRGRPYLYLYARTGLSSFSRPTRTKHHDVRYLERMLITFALDRNAWLINKQETKMLRNIVVPGLMNSPPGRISDAAKELQSVLGY
ncbi:hypothetical protein CK215_29535 [Mesorhizobium sp. WSM3864]|uniref:hypothetical protein n=1 Tax=Mesorhizobium sp. WSM3864 TaxID=2029404 RepID=UPI000BB02BDD|nr:hypothetical protein [Mesorhizobium sp. WSM3864]PBB89100.1 hypothetical protein CK215_29535 [Mesorhizobium sp. WSM3864]